MGEYRPIETMQRLEGVGIKREHAAALANEMQSAMLDLVTKADLESALNKQALRICAVLGSFMAVGFTVLGFILKH